MMRTRLGGKRRAVDSQVGRGAETLDWTPVGVPVRVDDGAAGDGLIMRGVSVR